MRKDVQVPHSGCTSTDVMCVKSKLAGPSLERLKNHLPKMDCARVRHPLLPGACRPPDTGRAAQPDLSTGLAKAMESNLMRGIMQQLALLWAWYMQQHYSFVERHVNTCCTRQRPHQCCTIHRSHYMFIQQRRFKILCQQESGAQHSADCDPDATASNVKPGQDAAVVVWRRCIGGPARCRSRGLAI